jgi:hypothetical protein
MSYYILLEIVCFWNLQIDASKMLVTTLSLICYCRYLDNYDIRLLLCAQVVWNFDTFFQKIGNAPYGLQNRRDVRKHDSTQIISSRCIKTLSSKTPNITVITSMRLHQGSSFQHTFTSSTCGRWSSILPSSPSCCKHSNYIKVHLAMNQQSIGRPESMFRLCFDFIDYLRISR